METKSSGEPASKERFLNLAMGVAAVSECRMKHGALVVKHGHILGASPNINKNNPKHCPIESCSIHAEMAAMRKARWPEKATIYVARINGQGKRRLSRPCEKCQAVLDQFHCRVVYTLEEE